MRRLALPTLLALSACADKASGESGASPSDSGSADSGSADGGDGGEPALTAQCAAQPENVLRYDCAITAPVAAAVTLTVSGPGVSRVFEGAEVATEHALTIWGVPPETALTWSVSAAGESVEGGFTTGALPDGVAMEVAVTGADAATLDAVLTYNCDASATALVLGPDGRVLWYEDVAAALPDDAEDRGLNGFAPTGDGVLVSLGRHYLVEVGWDGARRLLVDTADFAAAERPLHHDVHAHGSLRYALYVYADGELLLDGVYVVDADGALVADLQLGDVFDPTSVPGLPGDPYWTPFPELRDLVSVTHANSVFIDDRGALVISMKFLNTVIALDGDMESPDFGALLWALEGKDSRAFESDFAITADPSVTEDLSFESQHCAEYSASGAFTLFDNRDFSTSRAVVLDLDPVAGVAEIQRSYELEVQCEHQGAIYELPSGGVAVTCATRRWIAEYAAGGAAPIWKLTATCSGGEGLHDLLNRGIPISL